MDRLRILTWHVHGSYLDSLIRTGHEFFLPVGRGAGGSMRGAIGDWPWPRDRVHEVPDDEVRSLDVDLVLFQDDPNWLDDGPRILSSAQLRGPRIYVEHDPPWDDPTEARHPVDDPNVLLVHVTAFNSLMWNSGRTPTRVIEHGVIDPGVRWTGELERGLVVINNLPTRGRRLGADIFERARAVVPLDLIGMGALAVGGRDEIPRTALPGFSAPYRFFFHPVRYTSFGMALCEAMMIGMPVVGLATTEMPTVLENGRSGIVDTNPERLIEGARELLADRGLAARLGAAAREIALERFSIARFTREWDAAFRDVIGRSNDRMVAISGTPDRRNRVPEEVPA
jgi:glycosyltransferase involved in cell wall biosynthesis